MRVNRHIMIYGGIVSEMKMQVEGTQGQKRLIPSLSPVLGEKLQKRWYLGDEKVRYSGQRERPLGRSPALQGLCFVLGNVKFCLQAERLSEGTGQGMGLQRTVGTEGGPRALPQDPVSFRWLCKAGEENNVILGVGSRIPFRERMVPVERQTLLGLFEYDWQPCRDCRKGLR